MVLLRVGLVKYMIFKTKTLMKNFQFTNANINTYTHRKDNDNFPRCNINKQTLIRKRLKGDNK